MATVPVIYAAAGNCHVFVDSSADLDEALAIAVNAKTQRPGVCNAAETLLVHADVAGGVPARACSGRCATRASSCASTRARGRWPARRWPARCSTRPTRTGTRNTSRSCWRSASSTRVDEAIEHINRHGTGHSEAIVTADQARRARSSAAVDAACVYVNASTRFTDGGEFGMGAEIGNSTQKLHARGPIGLRELCTIKYVVVGDGHVRG